MIRIYNLQFSFRVAKQHYLSRLNIVQCDKIYELIIYIQIYKG